jgi:hypothetical protein
MSSIKIIAICSSEEDAADRVFIRRNEKIIDNIFCVSFVGIIIP